MEVLITVFMVLVFIIVIGGIILEEIAPYWPTIRMFLVLSLVLPAGVGCLVWLSNTMEKSRKAAQAIEAGRKAARDSEVANRKQKAQDERKAVDHALYLINRTLYGANADMSDIPRCLKKAEDSISRATEKFSTRSFYPFWDSIADAVSNLQDYKNKVSHLSGLQFEYAEGIRRYRALPSAGEGNAPVPFPASAASLPALRSASQTARRISALYDRAHQDYEFANIYANWKTNQTLLKGFTDLSRGLNAMQNELQSINFTIHNGFGSVNSTIQESTNAMTGSFDHQTEKLRTLGVSVDGVSAHLVSGRRAQSASEEKMIDLIDNIQRGRENIPNVADYLKESKTRPVNR